MKITLNEIEIKKELLIVNDGLNYGRFFDYITEDYKIQMRINEFINLIEKEYILIRDEIKIDDEINQDNSDFTNSNYCSLQELLNYESDLEKIVKTYLDIILFNKIFVTSSKNKYTINSTDEIRIIDKNIVIKGRVFKTRTT